DYNSLTVAPDGAHAAIGNLPDSPAALLAWEQDVYSLDLRRIGLIDVAGQTGEVFLQAYAARDIDFSATHMIVTQSFWDKFGLPNVNVQAFTRIEPNLDWTTEFPNCADDLKLQPEGKLAILAPRQCSMHDILVAQPEIVEEAIQEEDNWEDVEEDWWNDEPQGCDPISIVDLEAGEHVANVPGFGPALWSPDGSKAIGWTNKETLMIEWNTFVDRTFGVITVDVSDFTWKVTDVGDTLPRYVYSRDGGSIFVDSSVDGLPFTARIDPETGDMTQLGGESIRVGMYAASPDGQRSFFSHAGSLHQIGVLASGITTVSLNATGDTLNTRPQGDLLLWTDRAAGAHHLLNMDGLTLSSTIQLPGAVSQ
ncbi:MAG: hypothetical protein ACI9WU_000984, partial [Myxococcota bacterium]